MNAHTEGAAVFAHPSRNTDALHIEEGMTVADVGAGSGHYTLQIASRLAGTGRVYAIDVQRDLLRRIKSESHRHGFMNVECIAGDVEKNHGTHLADHVVDFALMSNVLFQLEDPQSALSEVLRIMKPNGRLAVIDWSESFGGMGPTKEHVVNKKKATMLLEQAGFETVEEFNAGAHHYGLICKLISQS